MSSAKASERKAFLRAIENEVVNYLAIAPRYEAFPDIPDQLSKLDGKARAYASAVLALNKEASAYLRLGFVMNARRTGDDDIMASADSSARDLLHSAAVATATAKTASRLLKGMKNKPVPRHAREEFVLSAARAYGLAFGWQAKPTKTGSFAKLLPQILKEAGIKTSIAEDRLRGILAREDLPGKPPKRGPKPALAN
jgi:hypothetical protein